MTAIYLRRGTTTEWSTADPVLGDGEPGYDTDLNVLKIGDGVTAWSSLSEHLGSAASILARLLTVDGSGSLLDADLLDGQEGVYYASVDSLGELPLKGSVKAATTANITLSGPQTIDGVSVSEPDRVLVKDQSTASENGIYTVSSGAWSRSSDSDDNWDWANGFLVFVQQGTVNADTGWVCTFDGTPTVGTSSLNFSKFSFEGVTAAEVTFTPAGDIAATDVQAALEELDSEKLSLTGGTLTGALELAPFSELVGETPNGWPLIPWVPGSPSSSTVAGPPALIIPNSDNENDLVVYGHRGHMVFGTQDNANLLGYGADAVFPFMTAGGPTVSGITFASGWRFNNDPTAQGGTLHPYDSGIRTGYGTGMHLTANYTASAYANNTKIFEFSPTGLLVPAASSTIVPLIVKAAAAHSVNVQEWQDSTTAVLARLDQNGEFLANAYHANGVDSMTVNTFPISSHFAANENGRAIYEAHSHSTTSTDSSGFYAARSRGSIGSPAVVADNDELSFHAAVGYDGTDYALGGYILFRVDGTPGNDDMPTEFIVALSADGSHVPTDRLTVSPDGTVTFGGGSLRMANNVGIAMKDSAGSYKTVFNMNGGNNLQLNTGATTGNDIVFLPRNVEFARFDQSASSLLFADGINLEFNSTTGTKIGTASTQKLGFYGKAPIVRGTISGTDLTTLVDNLLAYLGETTGVGLLADSSGTIVNNASQLNSQAASYYLNRTNHTGTQTASTVSDFDEAAQDAVGTILTDGTTIDFTYNDGTPSITAEVKAASLDSTYLADGAAHANSQQINTQTGTSYTLALTDKGKIVEMNNASANTLTVPPNSTVAFPTGSRVAVTQYGAGTTTIAAGAGVTIRSAGGLLDLSAQYAGAELYKRGTDEWVLVGSLA